MAFLQDYTKAKYSASLIFQLIEKPTEIDSQSNKGVKPVGLVYIFYHLLLFFYYYCIFPQSVTQEE